MKREMEKLHEMSGPFDGFKECGCINVQDEQRRCAAHGGSSVSDEKIYDAIRKELQKAGLTPREQLADIAALTPKRFEPEGDTRELAERHAREHAESINVPTVKMGPQSWSVPVVKQLEAIAGQFKVIHPATNRLVGIGGAPTRPSNLPTEPKERKKYPIASGVLDYFPDAIVEVARVSFDGNEQHHPGQPLHWDRSKSQDEADTAMRHFMQRGTIDSDGRRHTAKAAWRILALLQKEIEAEREEAA